VVENEEGKRNRRSIRAAYHNYGWSASYFITIQAKKREPLFDSPKLRTILMDTWQGLPSRFPGLSLDAFVIMPDHIHFIVHIRFNSHTATSLSRVVGAYKSLVAHHWMAHVATVDTTKQALPVQIWHRNYYERVIRDERELEAVRQYIRDNPLKLQEPS